MRYHLYCDESGQQSGGAYFVVGVALVVKQEEVRAQVVELEHRASRVSRKWSKCTLPQKERFLGLIEPVLKEIQPVYYRSCGPGRDYNAWTIEVIAAAALTREPSAEFFVMVDGLADTAAFSKALRGRGVNVKKMRGGRDESEPLLRLADFVAGFVGEHIRGKPYTVPHWTRLSRYLTALE